MQFANRLVGVIIDRFGKEIDIRKRNEDYFSVRVKVAISGQFFGWLTGLGKEARIIAPQSIVTEYHQYIKSLIELYE